MRRSRIFKLMMLGALVAGLLVAAAAVFADHTWYYNGEALHWKGDNLNPMVADRTSSSLYDVPAAVNEWNALGTPIQPQNTSKRKGKVIVQEGFSQDWLGLAQVFLELEADGQVHITKGKVLLNTTFLDDAEFGPLVPDHVLGQELGHIWGLDHNHDDLDTVMNDCGGSDITTRAQWLACLNAPGSDSPNAHDTVELNLIYSHSDGVPPPPPGGGKPPKPCKGKKCPSQGRWVTVHTFPIPNFD